MQSGAVCCCAQPSHVPQLTTTACPREGGRGGKVTAGVLCWGHFILQCCPMLGTKCKSVAVPVCAISALAPAGQQSGASPSSRPRYLLCILCSQRSTSGRWSCDGSGSRGQPEVVQRTRLPLTDRARSNQFTGATQSLAASRDSSA